jgi:quinol monooxygenase YgiN
MADNGQGDVIAAELMTGKYAEQIEAVFIHRVQPMDHTPGCLNLPVSSDLWKRRRINFFDTYAQITAILFKTV